MHQMINQILVDSIGWARPSVATFEEEKEEQKERTVAEEFYLFQNKASTMHNYLNLLSQEKKSKKLKKKIRVAFQDC